MSSFKVIIIGSGLSSSLLANGILHADINVSVYERLKRDAKREGYQIRLGGDALKGMRACLDKQQIEDIVAKFGRANGTRSAAPICYDRDFNVLLDMTQFATFNKSAPINRVVVRDLLAAPLEKAGVLTYDRQFEKYSIIDTNGHERVRVHFSDGSVEDCDILVGADGSHSRINGQLGLDNLRQLDSHTVVISKCDLPSHRFRELAPQLRDYPVMTFSDNKTLYYCAYLPDKKNDSGSSDDNKDEIDSSLSSCMFGVQIPTNHCPPDLASLPNKEQWEFVASELRGWANEYHEIITLLQDSKPYVYHPRASTEPSRHWRRAVKSSAVPEKGHPRVWLIGDAMHAMLPNRSMGGNTAMRDTATALPLLSDLAATASTHGGRVITDEVAEKLKLFEDEVMPRAFGWVRKSGGTTLVPLDTSKWTGRLILWVAAHALNIGALWLWLRSFVVKSVSVDDAPELRTSRPEIDQSTMILICHVQCFIRSCGRSPLSS
ncbi:FAD-binding domain-containing protein 42 [Elsinoe fawcettii]|nr:FAD-binding domain-containing protein 42 [Elsinoe fawcettii]